MVGHSFQNYDTIYVGFLLRILVKISYISAFIPRGFKNSSVHAGMKSAFLWKVFIYDAMKSTFQRNVNMAALLSFPG